MGTPRSRQASRGSVGAVRRGSSRNTLTPVPSRRMDPWVEAAAAEIARHAERELEALVSVSSPSGDVTGAEEAVSLCAAFAPAAAQLERVPCSTKGYAKDVIVRLTGTGGARLLLIGHLDTVVSNDSHRPLERTGDRLVGSGT